MSFFYEKKNKHDRESEMSLFVVTYDFIGGVKI